MRSWPLGTPRRTGIHDLAPAPDGGVWFTAQASGHLGWFDPKTGRTELIPLGTGSAPHGVIPGPDKAAWITDGGLGAIVRVGWPDRAVRAFALPAGTPYANLNTATFDADGDLWFTGQSGVVGRVAMKSGSVTVKDAPKGRGPYGIHATPDGTVYYASLAGSFVGKINADGSTAVLEPPTRNQGARRVWSDSKGAIWVAEWNSGNLSRYEPTSGKWSAWKAPGDNPQVYAVYVDEADKVWVSEWASQTMLRFDPATQKFESFRSSSAYANVRQIHGRKGEVWTPESAADKIVVYRYK